MPSSPLATLATSTWVWSWGSPAREVRWMKAAATSPSAPMLFWPPAPTADPEGMALEVAERLLDGVFVDAADDGRDGTDPRARRAERPTWEPTR